MKKFVFAAAILVIGYSLFSQNQVVLGPGVSAPEIPYQGEASQVAFEFEEYTLTPLADFELEGKVLSKKRYRTGREADLSPYDLALGWGRMSDESVLESIKFSQSNRWYRWSVKQFPIPRREIETSSANMHMIPANDRIREQLADVKEGQVIRLRGYLVRVDAEDGWRWISSTTRKDTGGGACEVIYVERFHIL